MITDDVDVSGCEFYDNYECNCHISECWEQEDRSKMMCKQVDDCYYKQLKLQEQENVRLREKFNNLISTPIYENCNLLLEQKRRLEKCLQEIKAIAEKLMADNLCNNCDGIGLDANCQDTSCPYYQMDAILQKITKAESEG